MSERRARAAALLAALSTAVALGACAGGTPQRPVALTLLNTESSWSPGQPSLLALGGYRSIAERAEALALRRQARRELELARIQAALEAARRRAKAEALRQYREAKRRALEAYRRAVREAARLRRLQARRLAALRRKRARQLAALRRKLQVRPGQECRLPEVAVYFRCRRGMTPLPKPLPRP